MSKKHIIINISLAIILICLYLTFKEWFVKNVGCVIAKENSSITTVISILTGIYFSMYTIFITTNINSIVAKIPETKFKELLKFLDCSFISSMVYVILSIISPYFYDLYPNITTIVMLLSLYICVIFTCFISCALRLIFKHDIDYRLNEIKDLKEQDKKQIRRNNLLDDFLEDYIEKKNKEYRDFMNNEVLKNK